MKKGLKGLKGFTTQILHADLMTTTEHAPVHKPMHVSVAYQYSDVNDLVNVFQGTQAGYLYARQATPTITALEEKINLMEHGWMTMCFSTGMAAIGAIFLTLLRKGDHIIASRYLFSNTDSVLGTLTDLGCEVSLVDATNADNVINAVQSNTRMVFVETIANPCTQIVDLQQIGKLCVEKRLLFVVDNTTTSPYLFQPKKVGASLIVNSLTKYICGHGNALGGAITDTGLFDWSNYPNIHPIYRNGESSRWGMTQIRKRGLRDLGATLSAESAHKIAMGAETLALRMERICQTAQQLAEFFFAHPSIKKVYYPGLSHHPQHHLADELFRHYGGLMSIELVDNVDCLEFLNKLQMVILSTHLGDNRTLALPVAHTIFWEMGAARRASMGMPDSLVRISVGLEDTQDILNDFAQALS